MTTATAALLIAGSAGLVASAILALAVPGVLRAKRAATMLAALSAAAFGVAGGAGVFGVSVRWEFFSAYALGRGGVHLDPLNGLFVLLLGVAATPLLAATTGGSAARGARLPAALRPLLVLAVAAVSWSTTCSCSWSPGSSRSSSSSRSSACASATRRRPARPISR